MQYTRNRKIDCLKGIAIIAMIIGHLHPSFRGIIYSFHMPLFFVVAGYFYKPVPVMTGIKKDTKRLLLPYIVISIFTVGCWYVFKYNGLWETIYHGLVAIVWANGYYHMSPMWGHMDSIGAIWFLVAMFWSKTIFNVVFTLCRNVIFTGICSVVFTAVAIILDNGYINLPFGIVTGMSALTFYYIGYVLRLVNGFERMNVFYALVCIVVWYYSLRYGYLEMSFVAYTPPILAMAGAVAATMLLYWSLSFFRFRIIPIAGEMSLAVLCIHKCITETTVRPYLGIASGWSAVFFDFAVVAIGIILMSRVPVLGDIFGVKQSSLKISNPINETV